MKTAFRSVLDTLLYISLCLLTGTGLLLAFRLIPGNRGGQGRELLGWSRHDWGDFHFWVALAFVALAAIHLATNWKWIVTCAAKQKAWRAIAVLASGAAIVAAFLLAPITHHPERKHTPRNPERAALNP